MAVAYPIAADLKSFLENAGLTVATALNTWLGPAIVGAAADFEAETGRRMLAVTQTRYFDPPSDPRGLLRLEDDLSTFTSLAVGGIAQVLDTDFRLLPLNAVARGKPFDAVQFLVKRWVPLPAAAWFGSIAIAGNWGMGSDIPDAVWLAVLAGGAVRMLPQLERALTGGLIRWTEPSGVSEEYGRDSLAALRESWNELYQSEVRRYRRVTVGV